MGGTFKTCSVRCKIRTYLKIIFYWKESLTVIPV